MPVDRLDIQVQETGQGARSVAEGFRSLAGHVRDTGSEFQKIKKHLKGNVVGRAAKQYKSLNAQMRALHHTTKIAESGVSKAATAYNKLNKENRALHHTTKAVSDGLHKVATSAVRAKTNLDAVQGAANHANGSLRGLGKSLNTTGKQSRSAANGVGAFSKSAGTAKKSTGSLVGNVRSLRGAFATLGGVMAARSFLEASDSYQNMGNRIRLVTTDTAHFEKTQKKLQDTAYDTRQNLGATVETYVRLRKATKDLGVTDEKVIGTLSTISKMLAISGQTAQESEQSIRQLSQAFSKGKLDGDEFRTVAEAMPDILEALQSSLGVTKQELYKMSEQGQLTSGVLLDAFDHISDKVDKDFNKSVETLGQSWEKLKTKIVIAIGKFNESSGAMTKMGKIIILLAENTWVLVLALKAFAFWAGVMVTKALVAGVVAAAGFAANALMVLQVAFYAARTAVIAFLAATGPIGAIALGVGVAMAAMKLFGGVIDSISDKLSGMSELQKNSGKSREESNLKWLSTYQKRKAAYEENIKHLEAGAKSESKMHQGALAREKEKLKTINMQIHLAKSVDSQIKDARQAALDKDRETKATQQLSEAYLKLKKSMDPTIESSQKLKTQLSVLWESFKTGNITLNETNDILIGLYDKFVGMIRPVAAYRKSLEGEIAVLRMSKKAQKEHNAELKVTKKLKEGRGAAFLSTGEGKSAIAELTKLELEKQRLQNKGSRGRKKAKPGETELEKLQKQLLALRRNIDPAYAAIKDFEKSFNLLEKAFQKGLITFDEYVDMLSAVEEKGRDVVFPMEAMSNAFQSSADKARWSTEKLADFNRTAQLTAEIVGTRLNKELSKSEKGQIASIIAGEKWVKLEQEKVKELESAIAALEKQNELVGISNTLHRAAEQANGLTTAQRRRAHLEAELTLYPQLSSAVLDLAEGRTAMTTASQEALNTQIELTNSLSTYLLAVQTGAITQQQYSAALKGLNNDMIATAESAAMNKSVFAGIADLFTKEAILGAEKNFFASLFTNAEDAMVSFITTGEYTMDQFKNIVNSMLADISRLVLKMLLLEAVQAGISGFGGGGGAAYGGVVNAFRGGPGAQFRHGGSMTVDRDMPGPFAHGGSFHVGGEGGPDTRLVQFMASPGERVTVTNPGQSAMDTHNTNKPVASESPVVIHNHISDDAALAAVSSPQGVRVITNIMQKNSQQYSKFLKNG